MKKLTAKRALIPFPVPILKPEIPNPNQTCPECGKGFYSALSKAFRDVQIIVNCPNCRRVQLIEVHTVKARWRGRCKTMNAGRNAKGRLVFAPCGKPICDRVVYDLPFSVPEKEGQCAACTLILYIQRRYKDELKAQKQRAAEAKPDT